MKQILHTIRYIAACLLAVAATSCTDDSSPLPQGGTTTIRLNIPMLEAATRITTPTEEQETEIKTLRVIISNSDNAYINQAFTADEVKAGNLVIDNVPVGEVQMYVIANEAALGKDYSDYNNWKQDVIEVPGHTHRKVLVTDPYREHFPKRGSTAEFPQEGLPMSWENLALTIAPPASDGTPQEVKVELMRAVAKLNILMSNALTESITIDQMSFGKFFGNCLYLFAEQDLDVPDDTEYDSKEYTGLSIEIAGGETAQLTLYIYPSFAWKSPQEVSPYTIGFHTKAGKEYIPQSFVGSYGALNSIARNTQVNIHATLSAPANVQISFEVVPWAEKSVEVPPFN
ncbi:MAG: FimB/Mfa2 family fimbrial subunit [Bacteroides sp.]|nr:FimB/Mfa2 family fimbrial subunit [Bacteroides sp.]